MDMKSREMEKERSATGKIIPLLNRDILDRMKKDGFTGSLSVTWSDGEIIKCDFSYNYRKGVFKRSVLDDDYD